MNNIHVSENGSENGGGYRAVYHSEGRDFCGSGTTPAEAVGNLLVSFPALFGVGTIFMFDPPMPPVIEYLNKNSASFEVGC